MHSNITMHTYANYKKASGVNTLSIADKRRVNNNLMDDIF